MCPVQFFIWSRCGLTCNACLWFLTEHRDSPSKDRRKPRARERAGRSSLADDLAVLKSGFATKVLSAYGNKTDSTREQRTHRRTKRFLSYPRFVEVMVVADRKMISYHGANLQHYVLTLMSIVSTHKRTWFMSPYRCHGGGAFLQGFGGPFRASISPTQASDWKEHRLFFGCCFATVMAINIECLFCDHLTMCLLLKRHNL